MNGRQKHNPKSTSPAIFIPCWLAQVSTKLISNNSKMLYGRLCQWSNSTGDVYRSLPQLSEELGTPSKTLERHLKELKDVGLIETHHPQAGGMNHYTFYYHPWMDEPINDHLTYNSQPPADMREPPRKNEGTPPSDLRDINKKEIKRNTVASANADTADNGLTKEVKEVIEIWNKRAPQAGCPKVGNDKRQLKAIHRNIKAIKEAWTVKFNADTFAIMLDKAIEKEFYLLVKFQKSLDVFLRWKHFEEAFRLISQGAE